MAALGPPKANDPNDIPEKVGQPWGRAAPGRGAPAREWPRGLTWTLYVNQREPRLERKGGGCWEPPRAEETLESRVPSGRGHQPISALHEAFGIADSGLMP